MLRATGFTEEDIKKPIITVAVTHTNATPCNHHIREMGDIVVKHIEELGGKAFVFGTPVVSDGETTGIKGMGCSLISATCSHGAVATSHGAAPPPSVVFFVGFWMWLLVAWNG
jgi:dihydroxyacid dehydratase/phosphogluconate dehydratase